MLLSIFTDFNPIIILIFILSIAGIIGAVVPAMPGTPLSMAGVVTTYFAFPGKMSLAVLITMIIIGIIAIIIDYIAPIWLTKIGGGSKKAIWGSTLGLVAGLFYMPLGLIIGPLIGAFAGEIISGSNAKQALKVALWSLVSFLLTTGIKLITGIVMAYYSLAPAFA